MPGPSRTADGSTTEDDVLGVVRAMLVDIIGAEYLLDVTIDRGTSLDADLELESLEFVTLAERLRAHYGEHVDFIAWLATKELDEIIGMTVDDLVSFVAASVTSPAAPTSSSPPTPPADGGRG